MTKIVDRLCEFCNRMLGIISLCVVAGMFLANVVCTVYVDYASERVSIEPNRGTFLLVAVLLLAMFFIVARISDKINEKILFALLSGLLLLAGGYLIVNGNGMLRCDPLYVYDTAREMSQGDYSCLEKDGYIYYFPHQLGIITYDRLIRLIGTEAKTIFVFNLLEVLGINFFMWRMADSLFEKNHTVNVLTIVLTFLFAPQLLFVMFAYGLVPGFFCMMAAFYCGIRYFEQKKIRYWVLAIVLTCLAVFIKKNFLIGAIALTIWAVLKVAEEHRYKELVLALIVMPCCLLFGSLTEALCELESGMEMNAGVPSLLYIGMGINPYNEALGPGWFDGSNWSYFTQVNQDSEAAQKLAVELIGIYWEQIKADPVHAVKFFLRKSITVWCEPLFQSVWSGPLEEFDQTVSTDFLNELYGGGEVEKVLYGYTKGFLILILGMASLFAIVRSTPHRQMNLLFLLTIGGFLFHLFWEAKSQYTYPYVFVLILPCAYMIKEIAAKNVFSDRRDQIRLD